MVRHWLQRLYTLSGWLAAAFIGLICVLVVAQVMLNIIDRLSTAITGSAIGLTIPSYSDFTGFFLAAASFLALAYTLRKGDHIRVTLVLGHLSGKARWAAEIWCLSVATGITVYFTWYMALLTQESWRYNDLSPGLVAVPIWIPQFGMLLGLLVLSIALIDEFICVVTGKSPSYSARKKVGREKAAESVQSQTGEPGAEFGSMAKERS